MKGSINNGRQKTRKQPNTGDVTYNAELDVGDIRRRVDEGRMGSSYYGGADIPSVHDIQQDDLVFTYKHRKERGAKGFVALNGFGHSNKPIGEMENQITVLGVAKHGVSYGYEDTTRKYSTTETTFAVTIGGVVFIRNTGTRDIRAGDYVLWRLPYNERPTTMDSRIVAQIEPYVPGRDELCSTSFREVVQRKLDYPAVDLPIVEGSKKVLNALKVAFLLGIEFFAKKGLVTPNFAITDQQTKEEVFLEVAKRIGLIETAEGADWKDECNSAITEGLLVGRQGHRQEVPIGEMGELFRAGHSWHEDLFRGVEKCNAIQHEKIIGKAWDFARSGEIVPIKLGRYIQ